MKRDIADSADVRPRTTTDLSFTRWIDRALRLHPMDEGAAVRQGGVMVIRTLLDGQLDGIVRGATGILRSLRCPTEPLDLNNLWADPKQRADWLRGHPGAKLTDARAKGAFFALLYVRDLRRELDRLPDAAVVAEKALMVGAIAANLGLWALQGCMGTHDRTPKATTNHKKPLAYDPRAEVVRVVHLPIAIGVSRASVWRRRRDDPTFPKAIQLGDNSVGVRRCDLDAWLESRKARRAAVGQC